MPRAIKDTVEYFPHYSNASLGDTLTVLQSRYGNDGYAFWFKLLEKLASTEGHYFDTNNPTKWQLLLARLGVSELLGVEMLNLLVEMKAIDKELWGLGVIWCQNLVNNLADVYKNRRRNLPQKPIITENNTINTENNAISTSNLHPENPQSKVKYSIGEYSKGDNNKQKFGEALNVFLTPEEHQKLIERFGEVDASYWIETLSSGKAAKPQKYKYASDYHAVLNWARRDNGANRRNNQSQHGKLPKTYTKPDELYQ